MNKYLTKIIFQIISGDGNHTAQFEEQLRFVYAESYTMAIEKSRSIGYAEEESFYNSSNELVQWKFIDTTEICQLTNLSDGSQLYSRIIEYEDGDIYTDIIRKKASDLVRETTEGVIHIS
ncbi:MAG: DUF4288 domain-containing protein [Bacteroidota bacterium]